MFGSVCVREDLASDEMLAKRIVECCAARWKGVLLLLCSRCIVRNNARTSHDQRPVKLNLKLNLTSLRKKTIQYNIHTYASTHPGAPFH